MACCKLAHRAAYHWYVVMNYMKCQVTLHLVAWYTDAVACIILRLERNAPYMIPIIFPLFYNAFIFNKIRLSINLFVTQGSDLLR
jgi:hypothetical protein